MEIKTWCQRVADNQISRELSEALNLPGLVCDLLAARGINSPQRAAAFLDGDSIFFDPFSLTDMEQAVERIHAAIHSGELIAIYGDFDCDGITSTVILYHYLESVGANITYYIPQRDEGYGLSCTAVDFMKQHGVSLVVTVDNGVSAIDEVAYAGTLGIDLVITDHHFPPETLPAAVAVVDPHRDTDGIVDCRLAGVGVAFKLICALEGDNGDGILDQYGDLIALGTIADLVELEGENRAIVRRGLSLLKNTSNVGLAALMEVAAVKPEGLSAQSVAFGLAPRINATGRMGSVDDAVELLLCEDRDRALELARQLDRLNIQRKEIEAAITDEILARIEACPVIRHQRVIVVAGEGWHHGVVGIVASKIVERFGKPCLLISLEGDSARGSGRSVEGFNLVEAISACSGRLTRYGGHNQAAGLSLPTAEVETFTQELLTYCAAHYDLMPAATVLIDRELTPGELSVPTVRVLDSLEPFGEGNPLPVFCIHHCRLESVTPVGEGKHLRLRLQKDGKLFFAMCFGLSLRLFSYGTGDEVDLAFNLSSSEYNGEERVTIKVIDIRLSIFDQEEIHAGKQSFDKYIRQEPVLPATVEDWVPSREEVAEVYRTLKSRVGLCYCCDVEYARLCRPGLSYIKICMIIELLLERGLAVIQEREGRTEVILVPRDDKVDLAESAVYQKIRNLKLV